MTLLTPEIFQKPSLLAVVGGANPATKQDESTVTLARAEHLPCMPRKRRSVKGHEYQTGLGAGNQQCGIVQAQP